MVNKQNWLEMWRLRQRLGWKQRSRDTQGEREEEVDCSEKDKNRRVRDKGKQADRGRETHVQRGAPDHPA